MCKVLSNLGRMKICKELPVRTKPKKEVNNENVLHKDICHMRAVKIYADPSSTTLININIYLKIERYYVKIKLLRNLCQKIGHV